MANEDFPDLGAHWWQRVATMSREELVTALARQSLERDQINHELTTMRMREADRESIIVACTRTEAIISIDRLGIKPSSRVKMILTNSSGPDRMRGIKPEHDHILLVPGWGRGKHALEIRTMFAMVGIDIDACRYAPSPETDRAEGPSNWGRRELHMVDDVTRTLGELVNRMVKGE